MAPLAASDLDTIEPLLAAYPFKPYRHYRAYSRRAQAAILRAEAAAAVQQSPALAWRASDNQHQAVVIARALPWDSSFFGVPMARIDYVVAAPDAAALRTAALAATLDACREAGIPHVTARVDVEDVGAVALLEQHQFRLMDALVTYRIRPPKAADVLVRDLGAVREYEPADAEVVLDIAREAFAGYVGRFQHDHHVPADRAEAFYLEWTRKGLAGEMADQRFVAIGGDGDVIGFLFFRRREPASSIGGVPIYGGGLGACRRNRPGAYGALIRAGALWAEAHGAVAETQTQNYNFPVIRVYEAAGGTYVRAEYTLHAWLGHERA